MLSAAVAGPHHPRLPLGELPERLPGGLRVAVLPHQASRAADAAEAPILDRIAPAKPEDALDVPPAAVMQDHPERLLQVSRLPGNALVQAILVRRPRPPAELGDPDRRALVVVLDVHPAELLESPSLKRHRRGVRVDGDAVEVALDPLLLVELLEEPPRGQLRVGGKAGEEDLRVRVSLLDRV